MRTYTVEEDEGSDGVVLESVVPEAHAAEEDREHDESEELEGLPSDFVCNSQAHQSRARQNELLERGLTDEEESTPESGNETSDGNDQVSDREVVERVVTNLLRSTGRDSAVSNRGEDDRRVESETVESDIEREPGPSGTEENLAVLPLAKVAAEVGPGRLGGGNVLNGRLSISNVSSRGEECVDVGRSLLDVALDIHGVAGSLGKSETEVEGHGTRNSAETDEETPGEIEVAEGNDTAGSAIRSFALEKVCEPLTERS